MSTASRSFIIAACVIALLSCSPSLYAQAQAQPAPMGKDDAGFEPIFNGKDLTGWEGDTKFWRVENNSLIGEITAGNTIKVNSFIVWKAGTTKDFELKAEYRISDQGNSGINYRSVMVDGVPNAMKGYQFDIDGEKRNTGDTRHTGNNYEERGRTFMALRGQITRATDDGKRQVIGTIGDYKDLGARFIKNGDWNQIHIIARGTTMIHILNEQVVSILVDDDAKNRVMEGLVGVQVHQGPPMKIEYRNILLKKLNS